MSAAATSAPPKPWMWTPGMTQAAKSSAAADSTHATSRRRGRMRGRSISRA